MIIRQNKCRSALLFVRKNVKSPLLFFDKNDCKRMVATQKGYMRTDTCATKGQKRSDLQFDRLFAHHKTGSNKNRSPHSLIGRE